MKKFVLAFVLLYTFNISLFAQGETCATAVVVGSGTHNADGPSTGGGSLGNGVNADWYAYNATAYGMLTINSCIDNEDTYLYFYSGACNGLQFLEKNDDYCGLYAGSQVSWIVDSGSTYYIEWTDRWASAAFSWTLNFDSLPDPSAGEVCDLAIPVVAGQHTVDSINSGYGASVNSGGTHAMWYQYTATAGGLVNINSCMDSIETALVVFNNNCDSLVAWNTSAYDCGNASTITMVVEAGQEILIEWSDAFSSDGFSWEIDFQSYNVLSGADSCPVAQNVLVGEYLQAPILSGAGAVGSGSNAAWYQFTATANGYVNINSCLGLEETDLYVYSGDCDSLILLGNSDYDCDNGSDLNIGISTGETIFIEWTDYNGSGGFLWEITMYSANVTQAGDSCAVAVEVFDGDVILTDGPNAGMGANGNGDNADWYYFNAPANGLLEVSSCGSGNIDTYLYLYEGTCDSLLMLDYNDDACGHQSSITYAVDSAGLYFIEWTDYYNNGGFEFTVNFINNSEIDSTPSYLCDSATVVQMNQQIYCTGPTSGGDAMGSGANSVWYQFDAPGDGLVDITSCGASSDTRLFVYTGTCASFNEVGNADNQCDDAAHLQLMVTSGTTYHIEWTDENDDYPFLWIISYIDGPITKGGDSCQASRDVYIGDTIRTDGTTTGNGAVGMGQNADWYYIDAPFDGTMWISSCLDNLDTRLYLYDGDCNALNQLATNGDSCNAAAAIANVMVSSGNRYYIEWTDEGTYESFLWTLGMEYALGLDENLQADVVVYPNPSEGVFTLVNKSLSKGNYLVMDLYGKQVEAGRLTGQDKITIDLEGFSSGIYLLNIQTKDAVQNLRLVKQ